MLDPWFLLQSPPSDPAFNMAADQILLGDAGTLAADETMILDHMNADHADAIRGYATALLGLPDEAWRMVGIDPEGCDLRGGGCLARLPFEAPVRSAEEARRELVRLAKAARGKP